MIISDRSGRELDVLNLVDDIRNHRHRVWGWIRFSDKLITRKLIFKGHGMMLRLVFDYFFHRLTVSELKKTFYTGINLKLGIIQSPSETFSADIDNRRDLEQVTRFYMKGEKK